MRIDGGFTGPVADRASAPPTSSAARFGAICLAAFYLAETAARLGFLVPIYHYTRGAVPFHAAGLAIATAAAGWMLAKARGRRRAQLAVALLLASGWTVLILFDVVSFATAPRMNRAMPLHMLADFYCSGSLGGCGAAHPAMAGLVAALAAALALALWACGDALGHLAARVAGGLRGTRLGQRVSPGLLLALLSLAYAVPWLVRPHQAAEREPLVRFLAPTRFVSGPPELITRPRPAYRVAPTAGARPRTLILITVDSLRADAVDLRGAATLTPFLRALAATGKLHDLGPATAICASSYCGIVGLQSGSDWAALQNGPPLMLADVLHANGYRSHFLLSGPHRESFNLALLYGPNLTTFLDDASPDSSGLADDREQVRRLRAIPIEDPARTYLSIHLMSAHRAGLRFASATEKPTVWRALFGGGSPADNAAFFRRGVRQADWIIGRLFAMLQRRGLLRDAVVVITGDHGERIGLGRRPGHGGALEPDVAAIPLLVYDTGAAPWPRQTVASQMDVAPTFLEAAGIARPARWPGLPLQRPLPRLAAPIDAPGASAMVAAVDGRRLLIRCALATGETKPFAMDGVPLPPPQEAAARAAAPTLHRGLTLRTDAGRCFR